MSTINNNLNNVTTTTTTTSTPSIGTNNPGVSTHFAALLNGGTTTTTPAMLTLVAQLLQNLKGIDTVPARATTAINTLVNKAMPAITGQSTSTLTSGAANNSITTGMNTPINMNIAPTAGGAAETIQSITQPTNGKLIQIGNELIYTPKNRFQGSDSFTYTNSNGVTTTVKVNVATSANTNTAGTGWQTGMMAPSLKPTTIPTPVPTAPTPVPTAPITAPTAPITAPTAPTPAPTAPTPAPTVPLNAPLQSGKDNPVSPLPGFEKRASPSRTTSTHQSHQPPESTGIKFIGTDVWKSSATWNGIKGFLNIVNVGGDPARGQTVDGKRDVVAIDATAFRDKNDRIWYTEDGRRILPDENGTIWVTPGQCLYNFRPDRTTVATYKATTYTQTVDNTGTVTTQKSTGTSSAATPLVLDLNGDGVQTLDVKDGVKFDLNNTGSKIQTGWVDAKDGLLVRDLNGNGSIDNGSELFGSSTLLADGSVANDGFQALAQYDSNGDKVVDASDKLFGELKVWQDANSDGISQANELKSLKDAGVSSLSLSKTTTPVVQNGNTMGLQGSFVDTDGKSREMTDVWFATQS